MSAVVRSGVAMLAVSGVLVLAGCAPSSLVTDPAPAEPPVGALTHVHAVDVDDARERVTIATHDGLVSVDISPAADPASPVEVLGEYRGDVMGFVRADDRFLLSGHPPAGSSDAANVGVLDADLDVQEWTPLALSGEVDFHAMSRSTGGGDSLIAGLDSGTGAVLTSADGGVSWERGIPIPARDIAVDPSGSVVFVTTEAGPQVSDDRGQSWRVVEGAPLLVLIEFGVDDSGDPLMFGVDTAGVLHSSPYGETWSAVGDLPFRPDALGVGESGTIAIVSTQSAMVSRDGGISWSAIADLTLQPVVAGG